MSNLMKKPIKLVMATASSLLVLSATTAYAQESRKFVLEEVTVTARKVSEDLQRTPVAVSAFTGSELVDVRGAIDITDLSGAAPNLNLSGDAAISGNSSAPVVFIRGIGQTDFNITTEPAVGIYVDGIYVSRGVGGLLDLTDVERVEVLRGPQGTLFGRNSIGGAINLISKKPVDVFEGKVSLKVGEDNLYQASGSVNIPFSDNLSGRFAAMHTQQDGFVDSPFYGDEFGSKDSTTFRGALRWLATDTFVADLVVDYTESNETPAPFHLKTVVPTGGNPGAFNASVTTADCTGVDVNTSPDCFGDFWLQGKFTENSVFFDGNLNPVSPENEMKIYGAALTLEWDTDIGTLKSLTGYRSVEGEFWNDLDHSPHLIFQNYNKGWENDSFSQELQLTGTTANDKIDYVAGLYYFEEDGLQNVLIQQATACNANPGCIFQETFRWIDNTSEAAFAQATWHVTDSVHLTGGMRYTKDVKDARFFFNREFSPAPNQSNVGSLSIEETTPLVTLGWDVTDRVYAYATYAEGFRDGGFPSRFTGAIVNVEPFDPEFVDSYELGVKADITDNLRINVAAFRTDYQDFQVSATVLQGTESNTSTDNLANLIIDGLELELYWVVTENLRIDGSLGLLDAKIDEVEGQGLISAGVVIDESFDVPYAPDYSGSLGLSYITPLSNSGEILTRVDWRFVDEMHTGIENFPETLADSYDLVNLSFTYRHPGNQWEFVLGAKNLTDEEYFSTSGVNGPISNAIQTNINRPRTIYGEVRYSFGG